MRAGPLDRRVTFQRATRARGGRFNAAAETWAELVTVWASVTPTSDGERTRAAETAAVADARWVVRWSQRLSTLNPKDRGVYAGRTWNILGVKELGRRDGLEVSVQARADGEA